MAKAEAFGRRLRDAIKDFEKKHDTSVSMRLLGELVAKRMGKEPILSQVIGAWVREGQEPDDFIATVSALAAVLETAPGYLAFGEKNEVRVYTTVPEPTETAPASSQEPHRRDGGTKSRRRA